MKNGTAEVDVKKAGKKAVVATAQSQTIAQEEVKKAQDEIKKQSGGKTPQQLVEITKKEMTTAETKIITRISVPVAKVN